MAPDESKFAKLKDGNKVVNVYLPDIVFIVRDLVYTTLMTDKKMERRVLALTNEDHAALITQWKAVRG